MQRKVVATVRTVDEREPLGAFESTDLRLRALPLRDLVTELAKKGSERPRPGRTCAPSSAWSRGSGSRASVRC
jgi:hypothetical protein